METSFFAFTRSPFSTAASIEWPLNSTAAGEREEEVNSAPWSPPIAPGHSRPAPGQEPATAAATADTGGQPQGTGSLGRPAGEGGGEGGRGAGTHTRASP